MIKQNTLKQIQHALLIETLCINAIMLEELSKKFEESNKNKLMIDMNMIEEYRKKIEEIKKKNEALMVKNGILEEYQVHDLIQLCSQNFNTSPT